MSEDRKRHLRYLARVGVVIPTQRKDTIQDQKFRILHRG